MAPLPPPRENSVLPTSYSASLGFVWFRLHGSTRFHDACANAYAHFVSCTVPRPRIKIGTKYFSRSVWPRLLFFLIPSCPTHYIHLFDAVRCPRKSEMKNSPQNNTIRYYTRKPGVYKVVSRESRLCSILYVSIYIEQISTDMGTILSAISEFATLD